MGILKKKKTYTDLKTTIVSGIMSIDYNVVVFWSFLIHIQENETIQRESA